MQHRLLTRCLHRLAVLSGVHALVAHFQRHRHAAEQLDPGSRLLWRVRHARRYPLAVGLFALISAGTGLYPFGPVLVAATVFAPRRWKSVYLGAVCGAVLGGMLCAALVQGLGMQAVDWAFADIRQHEFWSLSAWWIHRHGSLALAVIAALPVPQMPALIVAALAELHPLTIGAALCVGKLVKYGVYVLVVQLLLRALREVSGLREP